jgi:hypothetical protein
VQRAHPNRCQLLRRRMHPARLSPDVQKPWQGAVANTLSSFRGGVVGFIDWLGIVFGSQLALKAIQGREDETRQIGILPKESAWNRHEFATGDGAYASKH